MELPVLCNRMTVKAACSYEGRKLLERRSVKLVRTAKPEQEAYRAGSRMQVQSKQKQKEKKKKELA